MSTETHEPDVPHNWPEGHVSVELTDDSHTECVKVTIHGVDHYLHASTSRALSDALLESIKDFNEIATMLGMPLV